MAVSGIDHTCITEEQPQEDRVVSDMTNLIFPVYWQLYNASEILYILSPPLFSVGGTGITYQLLV